MEKPTLIDPKGGRGSVQQQRREEPAKMGQSEQLMQVAARRQVQLALEEDKLLFAPFQADGIMAVGLFSTEEILKTQGPATQLALPMSFLPFPAIINPEERYAFLLTKTVIPAEVPGAAPKIVIEITKAEPPKIPGVVVDGPGSAAPPKDEPAPEAEEKTDE